MDDSKPVKGYEGLYMVSSSGTIYSLISKKKMSTHKTSYGYQMLQLTKDGIHKHKLVHRLVAEAFIPNPDNKPCIDHIDGNPTNNNVSNLRWCTHKENSNNPISKERLLAHQHPWPKMCKEAVSKRSKKFHKRIIQLSKNGEFIKTWECIKDAAKALHVSQGHIGEVCRGDRFSIGGYVFRYAKDNPDPNKSKWTVDAFPASRFGSEPLIKIESMEE